MTRADGVTPASIVLRFNDAITRRDLARLTALMSADHVFIDTAGTRLSGRKACRKAWEGFFATFPDYANVFTSIKSNGNAVVMTGYSVCSDPALAGPAIWTATVSGRRVSQWAVHEDTPIRRHDLGLA